MKSLWATYRTVRSDHQLRRMSERQYNLEEALGGKMSQGNPLNVIPSNLSEVRTPLMITSITENNIQNQQNIIHKMNIMWHKNYGDYMMFTSILNIVEITGTHGSWGTHYFTIFAFIFVIFLKCFSFSSRKTWERYLVRVIILEVNHSIVSPLIAFDLSVHRLATFTEHKEKPK